MVGILFKHERRHQPRNFERASKGEAFHPNPSGCNRGCPSRRRHFSSETIRAREFLEKWQTAMQQLDYSNALSLAQANVAIQPNDYYGHSYLGIIYLAMGDVTNSETEYLRAYELFPSEDNKKSLTAIRKRIATVKINLPSSN
jgi:tetratricopeptide (TPR) repeat protein